MSFKPLVLNKEAVFNMEIAKNHAFPSWLVKLNPNSYFCSVEWPHRLYNAE